MEWCVIVGRAPPVHAVVRLVPRSSERHLSQTAFPPSARSRRPAPHRAAIASLLLPASLLLAEPAAAGPLSPIWTGVYAGFHGGADWTDVDSSSGLSFSSNSATFGGHLGLNISLGMVVVGVEADVGISSAEFGMGSVGPGSTLTGEVNAFGTARGRLGIPVGPALFYATAGYAWTDVDVTLTQAGASASRATAFQGIVYGVGAEMMVLPSISLRLEALRYDYGSSRLDLGSLGRSVDEFDPSTTVVRAGVSFRFN